LVRTSIQTRLLLLHAPKPEELRPQQGLSKRCLFTRLMEYLFCKVELAPYSSKSQPILPDFLEPLVTNSEEPLTVNSGLRCMESLLSVHHSS
jgi:hypothetical protein